MRKSPEEYIPLNNLDLFDAPQTPAGHAAQWDALPGEVAEPELYPDISIRAQLHEYFRSLPEYDEKTKSQESALLGQAQAGDIDSRNQLVENNLRLVLKFFLIPEGRGYLVQARIDDNLDDLIQQGNLGLINSINQNSAARGSLSYYAFMHIRLAIGRYIQGASPALHHADLMRIPSNHRDYYRVQRTASYLLVKYGLENPDKDDFLSYTNLSEPEIDACMVVENDVTLHKSFEQIDNNQEALDIEDPTGHEEFSACESRIDAEQSWKDIGRFITNRSKIILAMRAGLVDGQEKTLREIGASLGITFQRTGQIIENIDVEIRSQRQKSFHEQEAKKP